MNNHFLFISFLSLIHQLIFSFAIQLEQTILDISHFTFYYKSYHYSFDSLSTETQIIYNDDLQTNITINFDDKMISLIIDNQQSFNILNDNEWNEISLISSIQTEEEEEEIMDSANKRSLLGFHHHHNHHSSKVKFSGVRHGRNWNDAKNYCKLTRRGILATIKNAGENNKVTRECGKMGNKWHCWIGLRRPFQKWIDGSSVTYTAWMPGEPNNYGGHEDCTEIYSEQSRWNDLKCGHGRAFICVKRPKSNHGKGKGKCGCGCGYGCKKLTKGQKRRDKRRRRRWARIRQYMRWKKRQRRRKRKALRKVRLRNRRRRAKWRAKMRKVRRKRREELQKEYRHEMHLEKRRNSAFHLLNKLIGSALRGTPGGSQSFGQVGEFLTRRRRLIHQNHHQNTHQINDYEMISRCKIIDNKKLDGRNYEICINYNVEHKYLSMDIKFVDRKELKMENMNNLIDYRKNSNYQTIDKIDNDNNRFVIFDPMEATLSYTVWKYDSMDWHSFNHEDINILSNVNKQKYGQFNKFDNYVHYFQEFELYFNNQLDSSQDNFNNNTIYDDNKQYNYIECSIQFEHIPFKMCIKQIKNGNTKDTILYFEKDINDQYNINARYSFQVKEYIDNIFENNIFNFNDDNDWDEIIIINSNLNMNWYKKCNYRLSIAKICIEQFDINDSRASIKFQSKNKHIPSL